MRATVQIINEIEASENTSLKVGFMGLSIKNGNDVTFFESIEELKQAVKEIDTTNLYKIDVQIEKFIFLSISVSISYLTKEEINEPFNIVQIARNINVFDVNFEHIDNSSEYEFWNNLYKNIQNRLDSLTDEEISALKRLVNSNITIFKVKEMKKQSVKRKVFLTAWELVRKTGKTFAVCLSKSWNLYRLRKRMLNEVVQFTFEKADGTVRKAKGTLQNVSNLIKGTGKENYSTFNYFDVEVNGFRSFRIDNLITIF